MNLPRQLNNAHVLITEELLNNIEYRAQWFMNMALGMIPAIKGIFPDLSDEDMFKICDRIMEGTLNKMFGIELSAEATRNSLKQLRSN